MYEQRLTFSLETDTFYGLKNEKKKCNSTYMVDLAFLERTTMQIII